MKKLNFNFLTVTVVLDYKVYMVHAFENEL